jgi:EAL domain-containing protein (putative c-di-GMP-specific phosphodiesterase class I)
LSRPIQRAAEAPALADLASLADSRDELIWSVDRGHNLLAFNRAFHQTLLAKYGVGVAPGMTLTKLLPPASASIWSAFFERTISDGPFHARHPLPDGQILELSFNRIVANGEIDGISVIGRFFCTDARSQRLSLETSAGSFADLDGRLPVAFESMAATEDELRRALSNDELLLYYQPQVDRGRLVGAEALVRWRHSTRGVLSPAEFIPLAEETGLILPLGSWVLQSACAQLAAWAGRRGFEDIKIAVNICAQQAAEPNFIEEVVSAVTKFGANPTNLELEITENTLVSNFEDVITKMTALKSLGIRFALDDFGTGYSSLSYLKRLPLDWLKIDKSFIRDLLVDVNSGAITQTIISLGHAMGLSVIAEGVEIEQQRDFLTVMGCHAFQGYLISPPLAIDDFERMVPSIPDTAEKD